MKRLTDISSLGGLNISIKGNKGTSSSDQKVETRKVNKANDEFSKRDFLLAWDKMIEEIASEKIHIAQTFRMHRPDLQDDGRTILLAVHNSIQEKRIMEEQELILSYIHKYLNNYQVKLKVVVDETVEVKHFFTSTDKLQLMVQKNPDIQLLRKLFDLDLD